MSEKQKPSADGLEVVAWSVMARYPHRETVKALFFTEAEADNQGAEWCYDDAVVTVSPLIGAGKYSGAQRLLSQLREELAQRDTEIERLQTTKDELHRLHCEAATVLSSRIKALESQQAASVGGEREAFEAAWEGYSFVDMRQCAEYFWQARAALTQSPKGEEE